MRSVAALLALCLCLPAHAEEVDLELLLLADISRSMSAEELALQRHGYAEALRSDSVAEALGRSLTGRIAMAYVEWAGEYRHQIVQDWVLVEGPADLASIAARLDQGETAPQNRTSISSALREGAFLIDTNRFEGLRRVIDISGDGPNNQGGLVTLARDEVLAAGIVINGLPIMVRDEGDGAEWRIDGLDLYYADCVIGGPGAFVIPVRDWRDFAAAVTRKLVLEIAGQPTERLYRAQAYKAQDCLIGERMWERNRRGFYLP